MPRGTRPGTHAAGVALLAPEGGAMNAPLTLCPGAIHWQDHMPEGPGTQCQCIAPVGVVTTCPGGGGAACGLGGP